MKKWKIIFALVLVLSAAARLYVSFQDEKLLAEKIVQDDSFYYFAEARGLAQGNGITSNGYDPTNGFQPLWLFMITPPFFLQNSSPINIVLLIATIVDLVSVALVYKIAKRFLPESLSVLAAALYGLNFFIIAQTVSGLDVVLSTALVLMIFNEMISKNRPLVLGLLSGLAILARLDVSFLAGIIFLQMILKKDFLSAKKFFIVAAAIVLPWFIWSFVNFGTVQQSTSIAVFLHKHGVFDGPYNFEKTLAILQDSFAKAFGALVHQLGFTNSTGIFAKVFVSLAVLAGILHSARNYRNFSAINIFAAALIIFYAGWMWTVHIRYLTPIIPFLIISFLLLLEKNSTAKKYSFEKLAPLALLAVIILNGIVQWQEGYFPWAKYAFPSVEWAEQNTAPQDILGSFNSGILSYYSGRHVINLDGLLNFEALEALKNKSVYAYMKSKNISYWIDGSFVDKSIFEKHSSGEKIDLLETNVYKNVLGPEANFTVVNEDWNFVRHVSGREMGFVMFEAKVNQ